MPKLTRRNSPIGSAISRAQPAHRSADNRDLPDAAQAPYPAPDVLNAAIVTIKKRYGHLPNYRGVDLGFRWKNGRPSDDITLRIHLARKMPEDALDPAQILPKEMSGIPVDVIAGDYRAKRAATPHSHKEPAALGHILGGAPCARMSGGAGLAGVVVIDHQGRPGILSNWHVLAGPSAQKGDPIVTLRRSQGALHRPRIGGLSQWTLGKEGDAAIALLDPSVPWLPIQHHSFEHPRALRRTRLGEVLTKHSQSSGTTQARVDGVGSYRLSYETSPGNWEDKHIDGIKLVALNPASPGDGAALRPGDSGAVWMHSANQDVAGLQFASDMSPGTSCEQVIACHLDSVLDQFNARLADFDDFVAARQFGGPKELGQNANLTHPQEWADLWGAQASLPSLADAVLDTPQSGPVADFSTHPELASSQGHRDNIDAIWQGLRAALSPTELCAQGASLSSTYASGHHAAQIAQIINDPAQGFDLRRPVEEDEIGMFNTFFDLCWLIDAIRRGII